MKQKNVVFVARMFVFNRFIVMSYVWNVVKMVAPALIWSNVVSLLQPDPLSPNRRYLLFRAFNICSTLVLADKTHFLHPRLLFSEEKHRNFREAYNQK